MTVLTAVLAGLSLVAAAGPVGAQESAVLAVIVDLPADLTTRGDAAPGAHDRLAAALREWDRQIAALQAQANTFQRHVDLGLVYRRRGRLAEALTQFDAAAALRPGASDVQLLRAMTLDAAGNRDEAGRAYQLAWTRDDTSPVKAYLVLRRAHDLDAASAARATATLRAAYARILAGAYRPPQPPFLTLGLFPDTISSAPIAGKGRLVGVFSLLAAGKLDEAVEALAVGGPEAGPSDATFRIDRAGVAERQGRLSDARREYAAALDGTLSGRHVLHVGIARLAQVEGDSDGSIDAFTHAVRLSPNDPALRRELAAALVGGNRIDDAFTELVAALLIAPDDAEALAAVGQLFLDTDRAGEAIAPLRRALAVKSDRYRTHYALALALSRVGQADDAAREFETFERLSRQALTERRRAVAGQPGSDEPKR